MRDSVKNAVGYALEGVQLLRRHPSLLWVAVAMAAVTIIAGQLTTYRRFSRQVPESVLSSDSRPPAFDKRFPRFPSVFRGIAYGPAASAAIVLYPTPPPTVRLDLDDIIGAGTTDSHGGADTSGRPGRPRLPSPAELLLLPISLALAFAVSTLVTGGYLGAVWRSISEGEPRWPLFLITGRRFFWRLIGLGCLDTALLAVAMGIIALRFYHRGAPGLMAVAYAFPLAAFSLGLTRFAIVADDARLIPAIGRSISMTWRRLPTALVLIVSPGIINLCMLRAFYLPYGIHVMTGSARNRAAEALRATPALLVFSCAAAAVAAWFCAAMFLWYRDCRAEPRTAGPDNPGSPERNNADALETGGSGIVCGGCGKMLPPGVNVCPDCNADQ
jgi:hypothetical protein